MQTLWTRAAQARCLCNCSACSSVNGTIARRAATATSRRRLGRPDVFTVFSSTLAFSAALMDSARKEARNRQWEKVIGETKAEVEATELDQERRLASLMSANGDEHSSLKILRCPTRLTRWCDVLSWAASMHEEREADGFQDWRGVPLGLLQALSTSQLQELLYNKSLLYRFYGGDNCANLIAGPPTEDLSTKKLRTQEWSILKLVIRILSHCPTEPNGKAASTKAIRSTLSWDRETWRHILEDISKRLSMLKAEGHHSDLYSTFPSPEYPRYEYSPGENSEELKMFNSTILQSLLQGVTSNSTTKLSIICEKLLLLRIAPDTHTYNLLLVRFCQLGEESLVYAVLESMRETHVRPNEITNATMLRFFTATNNSAGFQWYVNLMNGYMQGLAMADPDRDIHPIARARYRWFGRDKRKIAEKARMNEDVYTALIVGAIRLLGRDQAILYYKQMIHEGWMPTVEILTAVLQDCHDVADFVSGWSVFEMLWKLKMTCDGVAQAAYDCIERLCQCCGEDKPYEYILMKRAEDGVPPSNLQENIVCAGDPDPEAMWNSSGTVTSASGSEITHRQMHRKFPDIPFKVVRDMMRKVPSHDRPWEKIVELVQTHRELADLKEAVSRQEKSLKNMADHLADLTEEVVNTGKSHDVDVIKHGISARITSLNQEGETPALLRAYKAMQVLRSQTAKINESSNVDDWSHSGSRTLAIIPPWMTAESRQLPELPMNAG